MGGEGVDIGAGGMVFTGRLASRVRESGFTGSERERGSSAPAEGNACGAPGLAVGGVRPSGGAGALKAAGGPACGGAGLAPGGVRPGGGAGALAAVGAPAGRERGVSGESV